MAESTHLDLLAAVDVLRRRAWLIIAFMLIAAVGTFAVARHQQKQYTATASIYFRSAELNQDTAGLPSSSPSNPQSEVDTDLQQATLPRVAAVTSGALGHSLTPAQVAQAVTVTEISDTQFFQVAATTASPRLAERLANTYARAAIALRNATDAQYYATALRGVQLQYQALPPSQRTSVQGAALLTRANSLQTLSQLQSDEAQLEQPASLPTSPSSPKVTRDTAIGLVLGLLLGLAVAFLLERFDHRIRDTDKLAAAYGTRLLGRVPKSAELALPKGKEPRSTPVQLPGEAEAFRLLRTHLRYFDVDRKLTTVQVTSIASGDGKTTVAMNLAEASASLGASTLLIEADLRRPALANAFGIREAPGLAQVLVGDVAASKAVAQIAVSVGTNGNAPRSNLDVLVAGASVPNPTELCESGAMLRLIEWAAENYELVVIDAPPPGVVSDAVPLLTAVDGVIIVARAGRNPRRDVERLRMTLEAMRVRVLGLVINGEKPHVGDGSSYYAAPPAAPAGMRWRRPRQRRATVAVGRPRGDDGDPEEPIPLDDGGGVWNDRHPEP